MTDNRTLTTSVNDRITAALQENELFQLSEIQASEIAKQGKWIELECGANLFEQGDPAEGFFLLMTGRMEALLSEGNSKSRQVGTIRAGETIGEMGFISGKPRALTIRARRACSLIRFDQGFLEKLPRETLFRFVNLLIQRHHDTLESFHRGEPQPDFIALVPLTKECPSDLIADNLATHWPEGRSVRTVSSAILPRSAPFLSSGSTTKAMTTLVVVSLADSSADRICEEADRCLFIGEAAKSDGLEPRALELLERYGVSDKRPDLILLHKGPIGNSEALIKKRPFARFFHVRENTPADLNRLTRVLSGRALGVTLGGGGVRGWAHIGAFKAILEAGYEVDAVGGTSAGAVLGSLWEISSSIEDLTQRFSRLLNIAGNQLALRNFTYPTVSFLDGRSWTKALKDGLGSWSIEDFTIPFHCVSCDIVAEKAIVHTQGEAWKWVRASTSLPGLFPPLADGEALHVDGAVIDNLPVETMRQYLGRGSKILAVDLTDSIEPTAFYSPPSLKPLEALTLERAARKQGTTVPRLGDTFLRALTMGAQARSKANAELADIYVKPMIGRCGLLLTDRGQEILEAGYQATKSALQKAGL